MHFVFLSALLNFIVFSLFLTWYSFHALNFVLLSTHKKTLSTPGLLAVSWCSLGRIDPHKNIQGSHIEDITQVLCAGREEGAKEGGRSAGWRGHHTHTHNTNVLYLSPLASRNHAVPHQPISVTHLCGPHLNTQIHAYLATNLNQWYRCPAPQTRLMRLSALL